MSGELVDRQINPWKEIVNTHDLNIYELIQKAVIEAYGIILIVDIKSSRERGPRILYANAAYYHSLGSAYKHQDQDAQYLYDFLIPEDFNDVNDLLSNLPVQENAQANFQLKTNQGQQSVQLRIAPLSDTNHCYKAVLLTQDIIRDFLTPEELALTSTPSFVKTEKSNNSSNITVRNSSEYNLQALLDSLPGIVFSCNYDLTWSRRALSQGCCLLTGYSPEALLGHSNLTYNALIDSDDLPRLLETISSAIKSQQAYTFEYRIWTKSGQLKWFLEQGKGIFDEQDQILGLEGFITDISELKQAEAQLKKDAFYDKLTGLPNRSLFMDRLKYCIKRVKRHQDQIFAVLYLDLDRFKVINDSLGHAAGDQLLKEVADRLRSCVRESDTLARLGGDEFTALLEGIRDLSDALHVCSRIQQVLNRPFNLNGREVLISISTGIALSSMGYGDPDQLLHNADAAMYRAKASGQAQWEVFTADMHSNASALLQLEVDLRRAIERQEFQLHYQPVYHLETARIVGFEALLRWHHPIRGLISPTEFIPIAETTGLILPISWWVLHEACRQLSQWQQQYPLETPLFISVNFSSKQFTEVGLIPRIEKILQDTELVPHSLKLEITESAIMEHAEATAAKLLEIKALGIQIGIDDFGTGYSSLSYLHRFPVDILKIDRSFVSKMNSHENLQIVQTITILSQNLGMMAVAEGVETAEQAAQLRAMNCQYAQGYLFSKPIDARAIESLLEEHFQLQREADIFLPFACLKLRLNAAFSYRPLIGQTSWTIGSNPGSDILLSETNVVAKHAMLQLMGTGNFYLVNLAVANSIFVNGQLIVRPTLLQDGDRITIGATNLVFEVQAPPKTEDDIDDLSRRKLALMAHAYQFQGEIWQAALTSQGVSVTWQAPHLDVKDTLLSMQRMDYMLPDLLLIDKHILSNGLDEMCLWCQANFPKMKLVFTNGAQPQVALSEHQKVIDYGAVDLLPGFSEHNVLSNLVDTLTKISIVLESLDCQSLSLDRKALLAALMPLQNVVKQGVFL